jgi:hypothetical protein
LWNDAANLYDIAVFWMRLAEWLERLAVNAKVAKVPGLIPASSVEPWNLRGGRCCSVEERTYEKKKEKNSPIRNNYIAVFKMHSLEERTKAN